MSMFKQSRIINALAIIAVTSITQQTQAAYSQMISFGDSLSDTGNRYLDSQVNGTNGTQVDLPYYNGRYSSGILWNEVLANNLGIDAPEPSYDGGTNYAYGGARVAENTTWEGVFRPSVATQVGTYLAANGNVADPNAIFTLSGGGNDLSAVIDGNATQNDVGIAAFTMVGAVNSLLSAGATSIIVQNVPDLGQAPVATSIGMGSLATQLTYGAYNVNLAGLDGVSGVLVFDAFALHTAIAADPASYGITNLSGNCFADANVSDGDPTPDCTGYVFTDDRHPSAAGHQLFGDSVTAWAQSNAPSPVPVPAALPLFASALIGLGLMRRKG